jgi:hypothetical protein
MSTATLAVCGCGGGSSTAASGGAGSAAGGSTAAGAPRGTSTALTRAELTASANTICKRLRARLLATGRKESGDRVYSQSAVYELKTLADLQSLTPPAEMAGDWQQVLATVNTLAQGSKQLAAYLRAKNMSAANTLVNSYVPVKQKAALVARRDGLRECAEAL